jgi:hypothetical protein
MCQSPSRRRPSRHQGDGSAAVAKGPGRPGAAGRVPGQRQPRSRPGIKRYAGEQGPDVDGLPGPQHVEALPCVYGPRSHPVSNSPNRSV